MDDDKPRHFPNTLSDREDALDAAAEARVRQRLVQEAGRCAAKQPRKDPSVYTGECGAALMYLKLAMVQEGGDPQELLGSALQHASRSELHFDSQHFATFTQGLAGALTVKAAVLHRQGEAAAAQAACEHVLRLAPVVQGLPIGECELLFGRCGYLHCLLFLRKVFSDPDLGETAALALVREITRHGLAQAREDLPLYYEWRGTCFFGAAHGLCGVLHTLLGFPAEIAALDNAAEVRAALRATVDAVLVRRCPSGNVPSSLGSASDKLVQWCHGAPGFIPLLLRCAEVYAEPNYRQLAEELGDLVWTRGLLQKGVGLCHGISGNGYMHLSLYRATADPKHLRRAQQFLLFSLDRLDRLSRLPDHPHSLFEGTMGFVCFAADVLHPATSFFPGYEV
eukprot:EG_transcript_13056